MERYQHTQPGTLLRVILGLPSAGFLVAAVITASRGANGEEWIMLTSIGLLLGIVLVLFHSLTVQVSRDSVRIRFGPGLIRKTISINSIDKTTTTRNRWFNGWGLKRIRGGWLFNVSGFDAVELTTNSGPTYRIGSDEPRKLLKAIDAARESQSRRSAPKASAHP